MCCRDFADMQNMETIRLYQHWGYKMQVISYLGKCIYAELLPAWTKAKH